MKIGDLASYTFIQKRLMVDSWSMYEQCKEVTIDGMITAIKADAAYLRTENYIIEVNVHSLIKKPQS